MSTETAVRAGAPGRRRFIGISAAAAGLALMPFAGRAAPQAPLVSWRGIALGAEASIRIHHPERAMAEAALRGVLDDVARLERIFSLYRRDSALVALNRRGLLDAPPLDLVALLQESRRYHRLTAGAFDPSVQPLWALYAGHFSQENASPDGPAPAEIEAASAKVSFDKVLIESGRVAFGQPGMALTLNGIAQGYITDRVVERLRQHGIAHTLVDMGESRALGRHPDGRPWQAGIAEPDIVGGVRTTLPLVDAAIATSGGYGFRFDEAGRFNHIFDPRTGFSAHAYRSVSVVLPTATAADALATAFSMLPPDEITGILHRIGGGAVHLIDNNGQHRTLGV